MSYPRKNDCGRKQLENQEKKEKQQIIDQKEKMSFEVLNRFKRETETVSNSPKWLSHI
jgi:hypothetical protein